MPLALFDLDETLLAGDSAQAFAEHLSQSMSADTGLAFREKNHWFMDEYAAGRLDLADYFAFNLEPLSTLSEREVASLVDAFVKEVIEPMILPQGEALLKKHRDQGDTLLLISATGDYLVEPIAKRLGIEHFLAVKLERIHGCLSGRYQGIPSFREGKVERLMAWMSGRPHTLKDSWFYSDSQNDLPLLKKVDHPVAVDPDPTLRQIASDAGWPIISLR